MLSNDLDAGRNAQVITERAVAVLGNLSTSPEYFQALRDAGESLQLELPGTLSSMPAML